jgi:DNA-binding HxlR family transcriptional regulator
MPYREFEGQNCSVARALAVVGERWSLLVVREVVLGRRRFREIQRQTGVATNILSDRLDTLVERGVLERRASRADPAAPEYWVTRKGLDLVPALLALSRWGDAYESPNGPPREFFHSQCGHEIESQMHCPHCGLDVRPEELRARPGPGATPQQRAEGELPARSPASAGS